MVNVTFWLFIRAFYFWTPHKRLKLTLFVDLLAFQIQSN